MMESTRYALVIVGTRPEAIKMLPVIQALNSSAHMRPLVISTGQHVEQVAEVLAFAGLSPDVTLPRRDPSWSLNTLFARVVEGIEQVCVDLFGLDDPAARKPVVALVHGDTTSAVAAAIAAFHQRIMVAHVEAGLRTGTVVSPFPEELNRQLIARIAAFHLAPTTANKENLILEGVRAEQIFVTGNTAIDALLWAAEQHRGDESAVPLDPHARVVVVTAHRRENWGGGLQRIAQAVATLARIHPEVTFVFPVHPNPDIRRAIDPFLADVSNVVLTGPQPYMQFASLLARAEFVITDSGGIQEEAPSLGTPVLVTRESTERREGVVAGTVELVGTDTDLIVEAGDRLLVDDARLQQMATAINPYGDGQAATRIVDALEHLFFGGDKPDRYGSGYSKRVVFEAWLGAGRRPADTTLVLPAEPAAEAAVEPATEAAVEAAAEPAAATAAE